MSSVKNKVDLLIDEIKKIQENCKHMFFLLDRYEPKETLEKGTFRVERGIMASCLYCSKKIGVDMTKMCPRCFGEMIRQKEERKGSIDDQLYCCKICKYTVHQRKA